MGYSWLSFITVILQELTGLRRDGRDRIRAKIPSFCEKGFFLRGLINGIVWTLAYALKAFFAFVLVNKRFILYDGYSLDRTQRNTNTAARAFFGINEYRHYSFSLSGSM